MDSQDSFREQVQTLVAEGKLTPEEAGQLLAGAPTETGAVRVTHEAPEADTPRRMTVKMQGASVQVYPDPTLSAPSVSAQGEGKIELLSTPEGWLLRRDPEEESWLRRLTFGLLREGLKVELRLPSDFRDLNIDLAGGNVRLHDLGARVQAKVAGGNLHLGTVTALHVNVTGGNVSGEASLQDGEHQLKVTGGNAALTVTNAPEVRLSANVVGGSLRTSGFSVRRFDTSPATARYESDVSGPIALSVSITGGSATLSGDAPSAGSDSAEVRA